MYISPLPKNAKDNMRKLSMATYREIQAWVKKEHGLSIKTCWIAHCLELKGLEPKKAPNRKCPRKHPCPENKREPIFSAFREFGMI